MGNPCKNKYVQEGGNAMKKLLVSAFAAAFIALGFAPGPFAAGQDDPVTSDSRGFSAEAKDVHSWIGKEVRNPEGEELGKVEDFVRDRNGEVSLVIISHGGFFGIGGENVAVPYSAFSFDRGDNHVVLDATTEELANAPKLDPSESLTDPAFAEEVYRHFGERPQWTDEGMDTGGYFGDDEWVDRDFETDRYRDDYTEDDGGINWL